MFHRDGHADYGKHMQALHFSGGSRGGALVGGGEAGPPLFWVKKEEMTERRKASRAPT